MTHRRRYGKQPRDDMSTKTKNTPLPSSRIPAVAMAEPIPAAADTPDVTPVVEGIALKMPGKRGRSYSVPHLNRILEQAYSVREELRVIAAREGHLPSERVVKKSTLKGEGIGAEQYVLAKARTVREVNLLSLLAAWERAERETLRIQGD